MPSVDLFPAFLRLQGRAVLLVGGGNVAAAKLPALLAAGAGVTVVAPQIGSELRRPGVQLLQRAFEPADLDGKWFAVAAAPPEINRQVAAAALERRIFLNAADDRDAASVFLGGVVRKGDVIVAVSTGGRAPAFAALLRQALERLLPDEIGSWLDLAENLRKTAPPGERRPALLRALQELQR